MWSQKFDDMGLYADRSTFAECFDTGLGSDASVVLDASVAGEIKNCFLAENRIVQVTSMKDQLIVFTLGLGDDLTIQIDDDTTAK